jgi:hypothetical protein
MRAAPATTRRSLRFAIVRRLAYDRALERLSQEVFFYFCACRNIYGRSRLRRQTLLEAGYQDQATFPERNKRVCDFFSL